MGRATRCAEWFVPALLFSVLLVALPSFGTAQSEHIRTKAEEPLPFVVLHGLGDACSNGGMGNFVSLLTSLSSANGSCVEVGRGASDSWLMRLDKQTEQACSKLRAMPHLARGFNLVGLSQGGLIARALIQSCDGLPPVHSLVSIGGPQAGVASTPQCVLHAVCQLIDSVLEFGIYSDMVQNLVAPSGYVKIPTDISGYLAGCKYLPHVNNELASCRNATYADRMRSLQRVALIKFTGDTVLYPPETAHFGFFAPNDFNKILPINETQLYKEDWVGMKWLVEAGRVDFVSVPGNHLWLTRGVIEKHVVPYLKPAGGASSM
ncbi:unnamed protein product [Closterium sp. NIES-65]|nr:unnamed protein product [Closterium sp. NIES-65]